MPARYMRGNKGTETPSTCIYFDTESYVRMHPDKQNCKYNSLRLWCATHVRYEKGKVKSQTEAYGETAEGFWTFVRSCYTKGKCLWMFAHNVGFDLTMLDFWHELDEQRFTVKPLFKNESEGTDDEQVSWTGKLCLEVSPTFLQIREERQTIKIVDTCNYWPKALYKIGKSIGLDKGQLPNDEADKETWLTYCRRDVDIIKHAVTELMQRWREDDCGVFQLTAPMMALTNFRHKCDIRTPDGKDVDIVCQPGHISHKLERECYFGGRVQCFYVGTVEEKVYHIDCNSLYPFVMREHSYPRRLVRYQENPSYDIVAQARAAYGIAARVLIRVGDSTYPIRINGKQHHCTGTYWTSLCGAELQRAIDAKHILRFGTVQYYSVAPLFRTWVDYWTRRKLESTSKGEAGAGEAEYCKLILNSLSGKFAQRGRSWKDIYDRIPLVKWGGWAELNRDTGEYERWRAIGGHSQVMTEEGEPDHSFPLISAFITSYAREYMRNVIELAGRSNVFYMATDAIICNATAFRNLAGHGFIHPTDIGKFKVVTTGRMAEIVGANYYSIDGNITASGMLGKVIKAQREGKRAEQWEQITGLIATGPRDTVEIREVEAPHINPDHRGIIDQEGRWIPFNLSLSADTPNAPRNPSWQFIGQTEKQLDRFVELCRS